MVKKLFLSLLLAAMALPAAAATARTYADALNKAGDKKAVVLFCYGANYDAVSEAKYEEFVKKRKIMRVVRNAVFLEVPIYQAPDPVQKDYQKLMRAYEKDKKEFEKIMSGKGLPGGLWSYPCLAVVDGKGNLRGIVQKADELKDAETASAALEVLLKAFDEQEDFLKKAEKASSARQAKLLALAADVDLRLPGNLPSGGKPMKDKIGIGARLSFDPIAVMTNLQPMSSDEANAYIRKMMAEGCYSRRQRQEMMCAYAGHLRRKGGSPARLRALYTEMRNIDPTSMYGSYAEEAIRIWVVPKENQGNAPAPSAGDNTLLGDIMKAKEQGK